MAINPPPIQEKTTDQRNGLFPQVWSRWFQSTSDLINLIDTRTAQEGYDNLIIVKSASDLAGTLDSNKLYMLDGVINMGTQSIEVPEGGLSIAGLNGARDPFGLFSSADNYSLFTSPAGGYSGDLVIESMTIEIIGTNSKVFGLDNDGNQNAIDIAGVNFTNCTSLGDLTSYRQLLLNNVGFISVEDGFTFNGTWSGGVAVLDSIAVTLPAMTLLKEGTGFTISNVRSNLNFRSADPAAVFCDFDEANITSKAGFFLEGFRTTATNAVPNIPSSSVYARIKDCVGVRDTYVGGFYKITSTATTTIASPSTPVKTAGTTTYEQLAWFTGANNNEFVYIGDEMIDIFALVTISLSGTANDEVAIYIMQYDSSAASYIEVAESGRHTLNAGGRAEGISIHGFATLSNNDRIEVWVENYTAARNVTAQLNGNVSISER